MDRVTPADLYDALRFAELRRARAMIENPLETVAEAYCASEGLGGIASCLGLIVVQKYIGD